MKKNRHIWLIGLAVLGAWLGVQGWQISRYNRQTAAFPDDSIVGQGKPVLVEIGAASCIYCRRMIPVLTETAAEYGDQFSVALVSLDRQPGAQERYGVQAIPTQVFYDGGGHELYRHTGSLSKQEILDRWQQLGVD